MARSTDAVAATAHQSINEPINGLGVGPKEGGVGLLERSAFLKWLSRCGITILAVSTEVVMSHGRVRADVQPDLYACGCCNLAKPPSSFSSCGSGYHSRIWTCCAGGTGHFYYCEECTKGADCWNGPFEKSQCRYITTC